MIKTIVLASAALLMAVSGAVSQIAPSNGQPQARDTAATAMKSGWVATISPVTFTNSGPVISDVPMASVILSPKQKDAYSYVGKRKLPQGFYAVTLTGMFNASEAGKYGFSLQFDNLMQASCSYSLKIDGEQVLSRDYQPFVAFAPHAERSVTLSAAMHPAELQFMCAATNGINYLNYTKLAVSLLMKAPSGDVVEPMPDDFVVHKVGKSGD